MSGRCEHCGVLVADRDGRPATACARCVAAVGDTVACFDCGELVDPWTYAGPHTPACGYWDERCWVCLRSVPQLVAGTICRECETGKPLKASEVGP